MHSCVACREIWEQSILTNWALRRIDFSTQLGILPKNVGIVAYFAVISDLIDLMRNYRVVMQYFLLQSLP